MAMNKREQAEMQRLRDDLALARALRWPDYPLPEPVTREWINDHLVEGGMRHARPQMVARGWFYNDYLSDGPSFSSITHGCSDGIYHNREGDTTSSQNMGRMYATEREALQALRLSLTEKCARILAAIDRRIAATD